MPERKLTSDYRAVTRWMVAYEKANGEPPSVREIGAAFGLSSPSSIHIHLRKMEKMGLVSRHGRHKHYRAVAA